MPDIAEQPATPLPVPPEAKTSLAKKVLARLLSVAIIAGAIVLAVYLLTDGERYPKTDDAYIQARYISVSSQVAGRIAELAVTEGQAVEAGQLLFRIEPESYELAVAESAAQIAALQAQISEAERQRKAALELVRMSRENTVRVLAQEQLAQSTYERMTPLAEQGFVTRERYDSVSSELEQAKAAVLMSKSNELAAELAVPSLDTLYAELKAAQVRLQQAELQLQRTQIHAPFAGRVVNCDIAHGMMVGPGQALFTLVDTGEWFVVANYREGSLHTIGIGATAQVQLLTYPAKTYTGKVVSIGHAVQSQDGYNFGPLPTVRNQLDWIRTAQRFPVQIRIEEPEPQSAFRIGASAIVRIKQQ